MLPFSRKHWAVVSSPHLGKLLCALLITAVGVDKFMAKAKDTELSVKRR